MRVLVLGKGKTGSIVAEIAKERGHEAIAISSQENIAAAALSPENLKSLGIEVAIDFTTPTAVLDNISACARAKINLVVGTTGWYSELAYVRKLIEQSNSGFVYGSNFSVGVNVFFEIARAAATALPFGYTAKLVERHHAEKKDSPSGTAATLQKIIAETGGTEPEITSVREGETIGTHVMLLDSEYDTMMLVHDAKSRRGFAGGAVRAAEWLHGKQGFYEFKDIFKHLA
jgi:4-hydroxy-tetrahydrodipicolinate reductase